MGPGVAQECAETKDGLHIWEDHFYPEVVDPAGEAVLPEGEKGELVFTSLTKQAMPVIRYRTRDLTRLLPGTARPAFRRMERVTGRSDDMIILRGVNVFPTQIEEIVLRTAGLAPHFQLLLTRRDRMDHLTVLAEAAPGTTAEQHAAAAAAVVRAVKDGVGVTVGDAGGRAGIAGAIDREAAPGNRRAAAGLTCAAFHDRIAAGPAARRAGPATTWSPSCRLPSSCSTSAATTPPAWRTSPASWASRSRRSTTTCRAKKNCCGWRSAARSTACSGWRTRRRRCPGPAITRLKHLVRGSVIVLAAQLPFVTLLLRVHGNTKVERDALARRREFDRLVTELVKQAVAEGDLRPDIDPAITAKLLFGLVNSLIDWYRPRRGMSGKELADTVRTVAFDSLRVRPG